MEVIHFFDKEIITKYGKYHLCISKGYKKENFWFSNNANYSPLWSGGGVDTENMAYEKAKNDKYIIA